MKRGTRQSAKYASKKARVEIEETEEASDLERAETSDPPNFRRELRDLLDSFSSPNERNIAGSTEGVPRLYIPSVGYIGQPFTEQQANLLIEHCLPVPRVPGSKSTDPSEMLKNVWQMRPSRFEIRNAEWTTTVLPSIMEKVAPFLGILSPTDVKTELHRLYIHAAGCEEHSYEANEKDDNHVATIVVSLPSVFKGGRLDFDTIYGSHDMSHPFRCLYAAFPAKCPHKSLSVTKGFTLSLVYRLRYLRKRTNGPLSAEVMWRNSMQRLMEKWMTSSLADEYPFLVHQLPAPVKKSGSEHSGDLQHPDTQLGVTLARYAAEMGLSVFGAYLEAPINDKEFKRYLQIRSDKAYEYLDDKVVDFGGRCFGLLNVCTKTVSTAFPSDGWVEISNSSPLLQPPIVSPTRYSLDYEDGKTYDNPLLPVLIICPRTHAGVIHSSISLKETFYHCRELFEKSKQSKSAADLEAAEAYLKYLLRECPQECKQAELREFVDLLIDCGKLDYLRHLYDWNDWYSFPEFGHISKRCGIPPEILDYVLDWMYCGFFVCRSRTECFAVIVHCKGESLRPSFVTLLTKLFKIVTKQGILKTMEELLAEIEKGTPFFLADIVTALHKADPVPDIQIPVVGWLLRQDALPISEKLRLCSLLPLGGPKRGFANGAVFEGLVHDLLKASDDFARALIPEVIQEYVRPAAKERRLCNVWDTIRRILSSDLPKKNDLAIALMKVSSFKQCNGRCGCQAKSEDFVFSRSFVPKCPLRVISLIIQEFSDLRPVLFSALEHVWKTDPFVFRFFLLNGSGKEEDVLKMLRSDFSWSDQYHAVVAPCLITLFHPRPSGGLEFARNVVDSFLRREGNDGFRVVDGCNLFSQLLEDRHVERGNANMFIPSVKFALSQKIEGCHHGWSLEKAVARLNSLLKMPKAPEKPAVVPDAEDSQVAANARQGSLQHASSTSVDGSGDQKTGEVSGQDAVGTDAGQMPVPESERTVHSEESDNDVTSNAKRLCKLLGTLPSSSPSGDQPMETKRALAQVWLTDFIDYIAADEIPSLQLHTLLFHLFRVMPAPSVSSLLMSILKRTKKILSALSKRLSLSEHVVGGDTNMEGVLETVQRYVLDTIPETRQGITLDGIMDFLTSLIRYSTSEYQCQCVTALLHRHPSLPWHEVLFETQSLSPRKFCTYPWAKLIAAHAKRNIDVEILKCPSICTFRDMGDNTCFDPSWNLNANRLRCFLRDSEEKNITFTGCNPAERDYLRDLPQQGLCEWNIICRDSSGAIDLVGEKTPAYYQEFKVVDKWKEWSRVLQKCLRKKELFPPSDDCK